MIGSVITALTLASSVGYLVDSKKARKENKRQKYRERINDQYGLKELYRTKDSNSYSQSTGEKTIDLISENNRKVNNNVKQE